jgi:hypothetical protein
MFNHSIKSIKIAFICVSITLFSSCIGTDYVDDEVLSPKVKISNMIGSLKKGESHQFSATYTDAQGVEQSANIEWSSSNSEVLSIDNQGKASALKVGESIIKAKFQTFADSFKLIVTEDDTPIEITRTGSFINGEGSYKAKGIAELTQGADGKLMLTFKSDFVVSAGPSVYVFLANKTRGAFAYQVGGNKVDATSAQITPNRLTNFSGQMSFEVPQDVNINEYKYVVLYCILGPVFGTAELK